MSSLMRIGYGEDSHRLVPGKKLLVGGVEIEGSPRGPEAHSDGDVLLHALADALLSAFALGDIGRLFPPGEERSRDIPGREIVREVLRRLRRLGGRIDFNNVSAVITLDEPKLGEKREAIEKRLGSLLGLDSGRVGVTFKTSEGRAPDHVQARVTVLLTSDVR